MDVNQLAKTINLDLVHTGRVFLMFPSNILDQIPVDNTIKVNLDIPSLPPVIFQPSEKLLLLDNMPRHDASPYIKMIDEWI